MQVGTAGIRRITKRTSLTPGEKNVIGPPLVLPEKIYLPPLHIKPGLMKNFVKGMDKTGRRFQYVRNKFPNVRDENIKEGIYIYIYIYIYRNTDQGTDERKQFDEDKNETERNAWLSFKRICKDFLGNHKAANYQDVMQDLLIRTKVWDAI